MSFAGLNLLESAKDQAQKDKAPSYIELGPEKIPCSVLQSGKKGGYAYIVDRGKQGAIYSFKKSPHANDWNILVKARAAMLLQHGYFRAKEITLSELKGFGCVLGQESINRVDYCFDFLMKDFHIRPEQFIAPPMSTKTGWIGGRHIDDKSMFAFRGRNLETVTVGKNPNLQVQMYDKRREAIQKKNLYWFDVWGIDPKDKSKQVIRIEVRAYKNHLKETWGLRTFQSIEDSFGDVVSAALEKIRYLDDDQNYDTVNVTRATLHPIWLETQRAATEALFENSSGLVAGTINNKLREQYRQENNTMLAAYARRVAVEKGLTDMQIINDLPFIVQKIIDMEISKNSEDYLKKTDIAAQKLKLF
tara:strand:- start:25824 stop:26906 length:1083 start_codon:yes stop_codon:yes gene_type:complete